MDATTASAPTGYATFPRRVQAAVRDYAVLVAGLVVTVLATGIVNSSALATRALWISYLALVLLYDPLFVSLRGGTPGHYWTNMRVVDERTGDHLSFLRAVGRSVLKTLLGLPSFVTMAVTRRNQTLHDALTRSTVIVHDISRSAANDYVLERQFAPVVNRGSVLRRFIVTGGYCILLLFVLILFDSVMVSPSCFGGGTCASGERVLRGLSSTVWVSGTILLLVLGWQGRLPGAKRPDVGLLD